MAEAMLKAIKPGSIVLMHANGRGKHTAEALRILISALKAKGYQFATVSQLIAAGTPVIAATCYSERPGDTRSMTMPPAPAAHPADAVGASGQIDRSL